VIAGPFEGRHFTLGVMLGASRRSAETRAASKQQENSMKRALISTVFTAFLLCVPAVQAASAADNGVVRSKSVYPMAETVDRLKKDVAAKGITFFTEIDQQKLAAGAGIKLNPSTLLIFGNPALGSQFITAEPASGIDWPVRLLVFEDANGQVWTIYNDFHYIANRHGITDRDQAFNMASEVIASITSTVTHYSPVQTC
jgi:uncharacterized protein (DUF302 family)